MESLTRAMQRRRPGQSDIVTARNESDSVQLLSGIFEGITTGTPIGFIIPNADNRSADYEAMRHTFRPSHADFTYQMKYGMRDHRGGGRSSARETASRIVGGELAAQALRQFGISINAYKLATLPLTPHTPVWISTP
jgi:chorismate synthase